MEREKKTIKVMCYAGPRMLRKHPVLGLKHLIDGRKKVPRQIKKKT